ncbi:NAD(P)/FAD-dependent oxidoreductase [bacterium]|nr:NAD(P)/FAD-dependent oxidoreductase [bacterium]
MPKTSVEPQDAHHVVIVGGGFGGLFAARQLGGSGYRVTLLDKRNFQLFQPLLYQVATGLLTVGDISTQQRVVLRKCKNVRTLLATAYDIDPDAQTVSYEGGTIAYDTLICATGVKHQYFGNDGWRAHAPGLKTVEHALEMRHRIFQAFEDAERLPPGPERDQLLTFVVVGAGPTGVELAGALADLSQRVMVGDYRNIDSRDAKIILVEGADNVLPVYPESLQRAANKMLAQKNVDVRTQAMVEHIEDGSVRIKPKDADPETVSAKTVLWAAGVRPSAFGRQLAQRTGAECDRAGRMQVQADLSLPSHPNIFVIGDLAHANKPDGTPLPGLAPVAIQQGRYVAKLLVRRAKGKADKPFKYFDKGSMAIIGRYKVVGQVFGMKVKGFFAWLAWSGVHILSLIEPAQRITVSVQWMWRLFGRNSDRLITGNPPSTAAIQRAHGIEGD